MQLWKGFQRPKRVDVDTESLTGTYGRFSAQPFERGFATTVGNAMRRCLLSSIATFESAPIRTYLPLLIERTATERLAAEARSVQP